MKETMDYILDAEGVTISCRACLAVHHSLEEAEAHQTEEHNEEDDSGLLEHEQAKKGGGK